MGAVLLALGVLALAYGGFSYTKSTEKASIGPIKIEVKDRERVNIPLSGAGRRDRGRHPARPEGIVGRQAPTTSRVYGAESPPV